MAGGRCRGLAVRGALVAAVVLAWAGCSGAVRASAAVPRSFVGMFLDEPVFPTSGTGIDLDRQLRTMAASGVGTVRVVFNWSDAQPYASWSDVPASQRSQFTDAGGMPTDFSSSDRIAALAAAHGLRLLPVVLYAPVWDTAPHPSGTYGIPARTGPYAAYVRALVGRYGSRGSFWRERSVKLAIRSWQIWNEPNIDVFWPRQPFASSYVALLRAAHAAIKDADPRAKVVLAGLPNYSWQALGTIYRIHGARRLFDQVAVHPYTRDPRGVITILRRVRRVMNAHGDSAKSILADEISWPSSKGKTTHTEGFDFATTEAGQARNIAAVLPMLAAQRRRLRLAGFDYYTWAGIEDRGGLAFDFAGLLRYSSGRLVRKPAFYAFRRAALAIEGCRAGRGCARG